jgi:hypothetical protein
MTIAAGFGCTDGILLCADSQYSGFKKEYRDKLFSESTRESTWAFAITGDEDYAKTAVEDSNEAIRTMPQEEHTIWTVRRAIRRSIKRVIEDYKKSGRDQTQRPEFLVALSVKGNRCLLCSSDTAFLPVKEPRLWIQGIWSVHRELHNGDVYTGQSTLGYYSQASHTYSLTCPFCRQAARCFMRRWGAVYDDKWQYS